MHMYVSSFVSHRQPQTGKSAHTHGTLHCSYRDISHQKWFSICTYAVSLFIITMFHSYSCFTSCTPSPLSFFVCQFILTSFSLHSYPILLTSSQSQSPCLITSNYSVLHYFVWKLIRAIHTFLFIHSYLLSCSLSLTYTHTHINKSVHNYLTLPTY